MNIRTGVCSFAGQIFVWLWWGNNVRDEIFQLLNVAWVSELVCGSAEKEIGVLMVFFVGDD